MKSSIFHSLHCTLGRTAPSCPGFLSHFLSHANYFSFYVVAASARSLSISLKLQTITFKLTLCSVWDFIYILARIRTRTRTRTANQFIWFVHWEKKQKAAGSFFVCQLIQCVKIFSHKDFKGSLIHSDFLFESNCLSLVILCFTFQSCEFVSSNRSMDPFFPVQMQMGNLTPNMAYLKS